MQDGGGLLSRGAGIFVGLLLVVVGVFFLAVNTLGYQLPFDFGRVGWPIFVIAPGLALLIIGLVTGAEAGIWAGSSGRDRIDGRTGPCLPGFDRPLGELGEWRGWSPESGSAPAAPTPTPDGSPAPETSANPVAPATDDN